MKIPVFCSLMPTELLVHLGHEIKFLEASEIAAAREGEYHAVLHDNICSYAKVLYDYLVKNQGLFDIIIVPTSCDAMKKLYNALKIKVPSEKLYLWDVPEAKDEYAERYFGAKLRELRERLGRNRVSPLHRLPAPCRRHGGQASRGEEKKVKVGILGANVPLDVIERSLDKFGFRPVYLNHCIIKSYPDEGLLSCLASQGIDDYAKAFLEKIGCPRTNDEDYKNRIVARIREEGIRGVIVNALKFCDFQPFDFMYLKRELGPDFPALMIEHELTANYEGQVMTRLEAFFEGIQKRMGKRQRGTKKRDGRYFVGIDSGSHATKLVCVDRDRNIICREVAPTGTSVKKSSEALLGRLRDLYGISGVDVARIVATGYGRNEVGIADEVVTEISCHAVGAYSLLSRGGTIIDIGGQDSKAIRISDEGKVIRFAMNDKCAAGTGRFLEVMALKLEMSLEDFSELSFRARESVPISSMCSVFAESEVISLIASGRSRDEIAKGIHQAIAERTIALAKRIEGAPPYYMAGGVAKNRGLVRELKESLKSDIRVIDHPQFSGALGAALISLEGNG